MRPLSMAVATICLLCRFASAQNQVVFNYTGALQSWTVPSGISSITVDAKGAQGGGSPDDLLVQGGKGGRVQTTISVTPGETLTIYVGGKGGDFIRPNTGGPGGFNGGGTGGTDNVDGNGPAGGGGGASDVRQAGTELTNRVVVAAGGGGAECCRDGNGGNGGGLVGVDGSTSGFSTPGGGGTPETGGVGGVLGGFMGVSGIGGQGGDGNRAGGGGGAGYYGGGGGGGALLGSGGGGGSSYSSGTATTIMPGYQSGNGQVIVSFLGTSPPTPRAWSGVTSINSALYVIGGGQCQGGVGCTSFGGNEVGTVEDFNLLTGNWATASALETPRFGLAAAQVDGNIFVFGGTAGQQSIPVPSVEQYSANANTWSVITQMPTPRWKLTSAAVNGFIYTIGGGDSGNQCFASSAVEAYSPNQNSWTAKRPMPTARWGLGSAVINNIVYVAGGALTCTQGTASSALESYDPNTDTWNSRTPMPTARWDMGVASANGKLYAIGGWDPVAQRVLNTVEEYNPATNAWQTKAQMPTARTGLAVITLNGLLYAFGGSDGNSVLSTLELFDPSTNRWTSVTDNRFLRFPLMNKTATAALINSVFDHSMNIAPGNPYQWGYCADNIVTAFTGETGNALPNLLVGDMFKCGPLGMNPISLFAWSQESGQNFSINGQYWGAGTPQFLSYDGHPGFDYVTTDQQITGRLCGRPGCNPSGNTPVLAAAAGTVVCINIDIIIRSPCVEGPGEIKIDHGNGYFTIYLHLASQAPGLVAGQRVTGQQIIGVSGQRGSDGGPHLHFEVRKYLTITDCRLHLCPVDPYGWSGSDPDPYKKTTNVYLWQ